MYAHTVVYSIFLPEQEFEVITVGDNEVHLHQRVIWKQHRCMNPRSYSYIDTILREQFSPNLHSVRTWHLPAPFKCSIPCVPDLPQQPEDLQTESVPPASVVLLEPWKTQWAVWRDMTLCRGLISSVYSSADGVHVGRTSGLAVSWGHLQPRVEAVQSHYKHPLLEGWSCFCTGALVTTKPSSLPEAAEAGSIIHCEEGLFCCLTCLQYTETLC